MIDKLITLANLGDFGDRLLALITDALSGKVDKVAGKGLSTNDYTTSDRNKLKGIQAGAQVNAIDRIFLRCDGDDRKYRLGEDGYPVVEIPTVSLKEMEKLFSDGSTAEERPDVLVTFESILAVKGAINTHWNSIQAYVRRAVAGYVTETALQQSLAGYVTEDKLEGAVAASHGAAVIHHFRIVGSRFDATSMQRRSLLLNVTGDTTIPIDFDSSSAPDFLVWVHNNGSAAAAITLDCRDKECNDEPFVVCAPPGGISVPAGHVCELRMNNGCDGYLYVTCTDLVPMV